MGSGQPQEVEDLRTNVELSEDLRGLFGREF